MEFPSKKRGEVTTCSVHKLTEGFVNSLADASIILKLKSIIRETNPKKSSQ